MRIYPEINYIRVELGELLADRNPWWRDPRQRTRAPALRRDPYQQVFAQTIREDERRAVVIVGPRQVGKTTLLLQLVDDLLEKGWPAESIVYFDFSDDRITGELVARDVIDAATSVAATRRAHRIFLLDEIRLSTGWTRWLKQAVDSTSDRFVVTDSAASVVHDAARESGVGRWDLYSLETFSFVECLKLLAMRGETPKDVFERIPSAIESYLATGGFPEHVRNENHQEVRARIRADVVDRAIRRDLAQLHPDVDQEQMVRLFAYLVRCSGDIFEAAARARDLAGRDHRPDERSVRKWTRLLQETMLTAHLERRAGGAAPLRSKPRIYAVDPGLVAAFAVAPHPPGDTSVRGRLYEAAVFRHLREAREPRHDEISYFRRDDNLEIDFIVESEGGPIGVEVTASADPARQKIDRLLRAGRALKARRIILVCDVRIASKAEGVELVPLSQFLLSPAEVLAEARS
jgi:predicted AAA+ superfamily ATPase